MMNKINKDELKLFNELLTPTFDDKYDKIILAITSFLEKYTSANLLIQKVEKNKSNVIAKFGKPKLLLNCHMDTVPPVGQWKYDPFKATIKDNKIFGLGACDTKGNLWAILQAVKEVQPHNLMLAFTIEEEKGNNVGVKKLIKSKIMTNIEKVVVFEPTECEIISKHKGYYSFEINVKTPGGHSSSKNNINSIVVASKIILKLEQAGFNIGTINGGKGGNIVSDLCILKVSKRTFDSLNSVKDLIKKTIDKVKSEMKGTIIINVHTKFVGEPLLHERNNKNSKEKEIGFWTEAPLFQKEGIKSIVFGAGSIKQAHKENEFIEISQLITCKEKIKNLIGEYDEEC